MCNWPNHSLRTVPSAHRKWIICSRGQSASNKTFDADWPRRLPGRRRVCVCCHCWDHFVRVQQAKSTGVRGQCDSHRPTLTFCRLRSGILVLVVYAQQRGLLKRALNVSCLHKEPPAERRCHFFHQMGT